LSIFTLPQQENVTVSLQNRESNAVLTTKPTQNEHGKSANKECKMVARVSHRAKRNNLKART